MSRWPSWRSVSTLPRRPAPNPNVDATHPGEEKKMPSYAAFVADRARVVGGANLDQSLQDLDQPAHVGHVQPDCGLFENEKVSLGEALKQVGFP